VIEPEHPKLSIEKQCELLSITRSSYYYEAKCESGLNLALMRLIVDQFIEKP
jgi:putative transposase